MAEDKATLFDQLVAHLLAAADHNSGDVERLMRVCGTDRDRHGERQPALVRDEMELRPQGIDREPAYLGPVFLTVALIVTAILAYDAAARIVQRG